MQPCLKVLAIAVVVSYLAWPGASTVLAQQEPSVSDLVGELQRPTTTDQAADQLLKLGQSDPQVKQYLADSLPAMIESGPSHHPQCPGSQWLNAVHLAGGLKIAEAALALAKWISVTTGGGTIDLVWETNLRTSPAGAALVQIGDPAIPALQDVLAHGNLMERSRAAYALNLIGSPKAKSALRSHAATETDDSLREMIRAATAN